MIINKLSVTEVSKAMNKLRDEQRMVLALIAIEGYSYKEVSKLLDIPIGTVMSRLARARKALMKLLETPETPRLEIHQNI